MHAFNVKHESSSLLHMQDRDLFSLKLEDTENWLYEDGEDQQKQVYIDKLAELKVTMHSLYDWTVLWEGKKRHKMVHYTDIWNNFAALLTMLL